MMLSSIHERALSHLREPLAIGVIYESTRQPPKEGEANVSIETEKGTH